MIISVYACLWFDYLQTIRSNFQRGFKYWLVSIRMEIVPINKKGDKQVLKSYRPVSLLPICGKVFQRLIFNEIFSFLLENNLVSLISYYPLHMKSFNHLMKDLKLGASS